MTRLFSLLTVAILMAPSMARPQSQNRKATRPPSQLQNEKSRQEDWMDSYYKNPQAQIVSSPKSER